MDSENSKGWIIVGVLILMLFTLIFISYRSGRLALEDEALKNGHGYIDNERKFQWRNTEKSQ